MNTSSDSSRNFPSGDVAGDVAFDGRSPSLPLAPNWNYETTVAEVEAIIARLEMGELELAETFDQFAIAVEYLRQCEHFLNGQQQRTDLLIETLLDEPEAY